MRITSVERSGARDATGAEAWSLKVMASLLRSGITMLPDGAGRFARSCSDGRGRRLPAAGFSRGSVLIDMSSSSPLGTRELGARLAERGVAMLDAPVSGGVRKAADATLSIMAGGDAHSIARCRPILEAMGRQIFLTGPLRLGTRDEGHQQLCVGAGLVARPKACLPPSASGSTGKRRRHPQRVDRDEQTRPSTNFISSFLSRAFDSGSRSS